MGSVYKTDFIDYFYLHREAQSSSSEVVCAENIFTYTILLDILLKSPSWWSY